MASIQVHCPNCDSINIVRFGTQPNGEQRYFCNNPDCDKKTFILNYQYKGRLPEIKQQIVNMALNGSGIRDTARVLEVSPTTVIEVLKKKHLSYNK